MNFIFGMSIILISLLAGEAIALSLKLPIPGNVIGMLLLAAGLGARIIRLRWVEDTAGFLNDNLAFFFVPAGVGLLEYFDIISREWPAVLISTLLSTYCVLIFVGLFHKYISRRRGGN